MKQKIQTLLDQLNHGLVEREDTLRTALLTVLTGENLVLIGPPGTGKSMIARRIAESFAHDNDKNNDNGYFEYLLTKFSTPEEIFGPLSITELKADRFKRNTAGYLPTVKIAFLDEIFKASSSILNALLTILNERIYHNGAEPQHVPMQALIAASNELPTDQEELSALYDRFLVRSFVDYVSQDNLPRLFEKTGTTPALTKLTTADLDDVQHAAESVTIPLDIVDAMQRIWGQHKETFKEDSRERLSDRRLKKVIKLLCVSATTNGRSQVDLSDVFLLKDCLWNHQENALKVRDLILNTLRTHSRPVPQTEGAEKTTPAPAKTGKKARTVVKGFKGSGTIDDPLLIKTTEELMDLSRPDVGLQGFYFRQTADIDCSALSSWTDIPFQGNYDGGGHTIKYKTPQNGLGGAFGMWGAISSVLGHGHVQLFSSIQAQSSITNLKLEDLVLANTVDDSHIAHSSSNLPLIQDKATDCTITACQAGDALIAGTATDCTITACQAGGFLINGEATNCTITACQTGCPVVSDVAKNCTISDCLAMYDALVMDKDYGGIALELTEGSLVERCFSMGRGLKLHQYQQNKFYGIAKKCAASSIRHCAVGIFQPEHPYISLGNRIVYNTIKPYTLENNASIDSNKGTDAINGGDGKTVAAKLFKQRYFEHTLGWDFNTVWQWDEASDRPALRSVGLGATPHLAKSATQDANMTDLLTQQIRANIWL
jgi:MoxR-like ATPase